MAVQEMASGESKETAATERINVAIVGLGLIGGSMARSLRSRWERLGTLTAFDANAEALNDAIQEQTIDRGYVLELSADQPSPELTPETAAALAEADVVMMATPVEVLGTAAQTLMTVTEALFTDMGSVKSPIMECVGRGRFIGGHPMAGSERSGYQCSSESLFENAVYVLCPSPHYDDTDDRLESDLDLLKDMISAIGAIPLVLDAEAHDHAVASISHLPHIVAAALVNSAAAEAERTDADLFRLAAGGFRDITRIASSDSRLWTGIVGQAKDQLIPVLERFRAQLTAFQQVLEADDRAAVESFFEAAAVARSELPSKGSGALATDALIRIELPDRPGEIAVVATLLAVRGINIQNIGIVNARQYEGGRIHLYLSSDNQVEPALAILRSAGYECS